MVLGLILCRWFVLFVQHQNTLFKVNCWYIEYIVCVCILYTILLYYMSRYVPFIILIWFLSKQSTWKQIIEWGYDVDCWINEQFILHMNYMIWSIHHSIHTHTHTFTYMHCLNNYDKWIQKACRQTFSQLWCSIQICLLLFHWNLRYGCCMYDNNWGRSTHPYF